MKLEPLQIVAGLFMLGCLAVWALLGFPMDHNRTIGNPPCVAIDGKPCRIVELAPEDITGFRFDPRTVNVPLETGRYVCSNMLDAAEIMQKEGVRADQIREIIDSSHDHLCRIVSVDGVPR